MAIYIPKQHISKFSYSLGQSVTTSVPMNSRDGTEIILLCGKEKNNDLLSFGLGKIIFISNFYPNFRLKAAITFNKSSGNNSTKVCTNSFMIDVFTFPLENATGDTFLKPLSIVRDGKFLSSEICMLLLVKSAFVLSLITFVLCIRK